MKSVDNFDKIRKLPFFKDPDTYENGSIDLQEANFFFSNIILDIAVEVSRIIIQFQAKKTLFTEGVEFLVRIPLRNLKSFIRVMKKSIMLRWKL
jgi:hypothetical protein